VTRLRAERLRNRVSNPSKEEGFSFLKHSHWLRCQCKISIKWVPGALGVKRSGSEDGHSAPAKVEVKMHGVISELHHTPLRRARGQLLILSLYSLYSGESLLVAFVIFRKASVSFVMSVRPSAWNSSAPIGRIFMKSDI
jgi:hypothetical protein